MEAYLVLWISLIIKVLLVSRTQGAARFTVIPPSVSYVSVGETAKLVWDYSVDDRDIEFHVSSPRWMFYADNDRAFQIAQENIIKKWKWNINTNTCPPRLLNPVRVSKVATATLVIHNVTLADSGTYGCVLMLATRSPITSKVELVVTSFTNITLNPSFSNILVNESEGILISCSAVGIPEPNVTWLRLMDGGKLHKNQGVGNVKINISSIARNDSGTYNCCASNNPKENPACRSTTISVQYKPEIDVFQSNDTVSSYNDGTIRIYCLAHGVPSPLFTWYDPRNRSIARGSHNVTSVGVLELVTINADSYGLYRCKAENLLGYDEHFINVTQTALPTSTVASESNSHAKGLISSANRVSTDKWIDISSISSTNIVLSTPRVQQEKTRSPVGRNIPLKVNKDIILLAAGGAVIFALITAIIILAVMIYIKHSNNKADRKEKPGENEVPSSPLEAIEDDIPIYARVDLSKKKRTRQQGDIPIHAQVDRSKKERPGQIIYAELDLLSSSEVIPPPIPERDAYSDIDCRQTSCHGDNVEPIYESVFME